MIICSLLIGKIQGLKSDQSTWIISIGSRSTNLWKKLKRRIVRIRSESCSSIRIFISCLEGLKCPKLSMRRRMKRHRVSTWISNPSIICSYTNHISRIKDLCKRASFQIWLMIGTKTCTKENQKSVGQTRHQCLVAEASSINQGSLKWTLTRTTQNQLSLGGQACLRYN